MRSIVHISGYTLAEMPDTDAYSRDNLALTGRIKDWEEVCWGKSTLLGRIPMGLWLARHFDADVIWSTGASKREDDRWEAQVLADTAKERYERLHRQFPHRFTKRTWNSRDAFESWMLRRSMFDTTSRNTSESMAIARNLISDIARRERVFAYFVTSANHLPRVMRDAEQAFGIGIGSSPFLSRVTLFGVPSETNYGGSYVASTVVRDLGI